jgi:hypothetical protein
VTYWKEWVKFFQERAFLPVYDRSGAGLLSLEAVHVLKSRISSLYLLMMSVAVCYTSIASDAKSAVLIFYKGLSFNSTAYPRIRFIRRMAL